MTVPVVRFTIAGQETASVGLGRPYTCVYDGTCKVCGRAAPNWGDERNRGLLDEPRRKKGKKPKAPATNPSSGDPNADGVARSARDAETVDEDADDDVKPTPMAATSTSEGVAATADDGDREYLFLSRTTYTPTEKPAFTVQDPLGARGTTPEELSCT